MFNAAKEPELRFRLVFRAALGVNLARFRVDDFEAAVDW